MKRWITRGLMLSSALGVGACKVAELDHCLHRGEHVWCEANEPDRRFCSPCEAVGEHFGCVAEAPSADACPAFESPSTDAVDPSTGSESTSGSTGAAVEADTSAGSSTDGAVVTPDDRRAAAQRLDERHAAARP